MRQNYTILCPEIANDPLERGYAAMSDEELANSLNTADRSKPDTTKYTLREYLRRYGLDGVESMRAAVAAASPTAIEVLTDYGENGGLDFSHENTVHAIGDLQTAGALTAEQAANWIALGVNTVSRATELGLPAVTVGHVNSARLVNSRS